MPYIVIPSLLVVAAPLKALVAISGVPACMPDHVVVRDAVLQ